MAATVQELIEFCLVELAKIQKNKAKIISAHFGTIQSFKDANEDALLNIRFINGERAFNLTHNELDRIKALRQGTILDGDLVPSQNFTKIFAEIFLDTQIKSIRQLAIEGLNCNPILATALKLDNPTKLLQYSVYQSASRSIVTSFGFFVQKLLLCSGEHIYDAKNEMSLHDTKWDLIKKLGEIKSWIEVKSGPNDLNKTQIISYQKAIELVEQQGDKAYIGETYGTRDLETITHSLYKQYLANWKERTLIGRELWAFVSDDQEYHEKLMAILRGVAQSILHERSIIDEIELKIEELLTDFNNRYTSVDNFIDTLW